VAIEGISAAGKSPESRLPGASSTSPVKAGICGCTRTFWKDARHEAAQRIDPYSRLTRSLGSMPGGSPNDAHLSMVLMHIRNSCPWITVSNNLTPQSWPT